MNRVPAYDYRVVESFLVSLDCPRSLTVLIMLRESEFDQIVSLGFNPLDYNSVSSARDSLAATELLRKHEDLPTNFDRKSLAFQSFLEAEERCKQTNERLRASNSHAAVLYRAQRKIADVLGEFDAGEMFDVSGWGPGSTLFIKRARASTSNKFRQKAEFTPGLFVFARSLLNTAYPKWQFSPVISKTNKVITVPKNAKTDRIIAVEPSVNLFLQKGIGTMIRRRLKRFAVDLNDQSVNQGLARIGSSTNELATVDFSAASDTIAYLLILDLLPFKWFQVLDVVRSPSGYIKELDKIVEYEKFSSMGNGFTFELESLIFWALAHACVPDDHPLKDKINVFGDDVILPSECVPLYREICDYCGFTVNMKKSYSSSYYRESCGGHYWNGVDITPIYNRRYLKSRKGTEAMRFHNRIVEYSTRTIGTGFRDTRFRSCIQLLWNSRDPFLKDCVCPAGFGDLGYIRSFDEATPVFNRKYQRGWFGRTCQEISGKEVEDDESLLLSRLYHLWKHPTPMV